MIQRLASVSIVFAVCIACVSAAAAAVLTDPAITENGKVVELHFRMVGYGHIDWQTSIHGQQLWIDLTNARMRMAGQPFQGPMPSPVGGVRIIEPGGDASRIIIDVDGKADYAIGNLAHQLIVRLAPAGAVPNLAEPFMTRNAQLARRRWPQRPRVNVAEYARRPLAPPNSHSSESRPSPNVANPPFTPNSAETSHGGAVAHYRVQKAALFPPNSTPAHPLVVVDPGHGGHDPGTEVDPLYPEKTLALQIATRLAKALIARGINVIMTRTTDTFLTLAQRTAIANRAHADLFISIHLNSSPDPAVAGIETYYLNNTTDRATIRLARMENGVAGGYSLKTEPNLNYILTDMRQQYKAVESASLARMIETATVADVGDLTGIRLDALGAKRGPFYVLVGAMMPAVLVECGFLSNPVEAQRLTTPAYQQAIADGIADAVVHYFNADAAVGNL